MKKYCAVFCLIIRDYDDRMFRFYGGPHAPSLIRA